MSRQQRFLTALVGFGKMGQGYAADPVMARHFPYAAHAQVLRDHPRFAWDAVIDPATEAQTAAREDWGVALCADSAEALGDFAAAVEVAVIATGPQARSGLLDCFPALKAVIVEKPLGTTLEDAEAFLRECSARDILVQVNLWRRADMVFRKLAEGQLTELIGMPRAATCYYGNGLVNNGTHMVDFARMLFGDIASWALSGGRPGFVEGPILGDTNPGFLLEMTSGLEIAFQPLRFAEYRENGLIVWGSKGRLDILAEGLLIQHFPVADHRAMSGEREIAVDQPAMFPAAAGTALYAMYENLADCLDREDPASLCSSGASALTTTTIVNAVRLADSQRSG